MEKFFQYIPDYDSEVIVLISRERFEEVIFQTIVRGATVISADVKAAFEQAIEKESSGAAKTGLSRTCQSIILSSEMKKPACPDTGWPIFFFKVGNECELEGGFLALEEATRAAVERATKEGFLRATMKHPLTGFDPGNNIGMNIPDFTYQFVPGDSIEVTYVAKGGGSDCVGGTRHRVVAFADGVQGIEKFVVLCKKELWFTEGYKIPCSTAVNGHMGVIVFLYG